MAKKTVARTALKTTITKSEVFVLRVNTLARDIQEGKCGIPSKCMEKIAIAREMRVLDPNGGSHKVRIDAALVRLNFRGCNWEAPTARVAKQALIKFDSEKKARQKAEAEGKVFVSSVKPHSYNLRFRNVGKIRPLTAERLTQMRETAKRRAAAGLVSPGIRLRERIAGLGNV